MPKSSTTKEAKPLLESDSESDSDSDSSSSGDDSVLVNKNNTSKQENDDNDKPSVQFSINTKFAKDYESRKQQEELARDRERRQRYGEDSDNDDEDSDASTSSSEDEDAELLTAKLDTDILKTINALRNKDDTIYNSSVRFFPGSDAESSDDDDEDDDAPRNSKQPKKSKPKRAKDVIREQILAQMKEEEEGQTATHDSNQPSSARDEKTSRLAYDEQQQALRQAFLKDHPDSDDNDSKNDDEKEDDDFLVLKKRHNSNHTNEVDEETKQQFEQELRHLEDSVLSSGKTNKDALVDPRGEVENGEKFLLNFIKNKTWIDKSQEGKFGHDDHSDDDDDDESLEALEKSDDFEAKYNFRFEEAMQHAESTSGADHSVMGYARSQTMNTLRRKDETRRDKRLARKERKAAERKAKEEKLRRLKNAKREEMEQKMKQVKAVLGAKANATSAITGAGDDDEGHPGSMEDLKDAPLDEAAIMKLLEGDYDPEKFEKSMQEAFGDDFYQKEDAEWKTDEDVKETLQKDGDVDMMDYDDADDTGEAYANDDVDGNEGEEYGDDEEEGDYEDYGHNDDGEETQIEKKVRAKMMDKLYELDYEDIVAGMPTRFKYREVEANDYGLSTEEILLARDQTLKQFVSLKKMAPYNEEGEYHVTSRKRRKFREMLQQDIEDAEKQMKEQGITVNDNHRTDDGGDDTEVTKKKKRRRMKKSGDKDMPSSQSQEDAPEASEKNDSKDDTKEDGNDEGKKKRRRKKKGKKIPPTDPSKPHETVKISLVSTAKTSTNDQEPIIKKTVDKESSKTSEKSQKKKKKKSKKDKVKVKGVSASRLASYDL